MVADDSVAGNYLDGNIDEADPQEAAPSGSGKHVQVFGQTDEIATSSLAGVLFAFCSPMKPNNSQDEQALQKDPDDWKTGDEPMTAAQRSYLETLASDIGESFNGERTKAEASKLIEEMRQRSPRVAED